MDDGIDTNTHRSLTPVSAPLVKQNEKEKLAVLLEERKLQRKEREFQTAVTDKFSHYFSYLCVNKVHLLTSDLKNLTEKQVYMMHARFARRMKFWAVASALFFCIPVLGQITLFFRALPGDNLPLSWRYLWTATRLKITHGKKWLPLENIRQYSALSHISYPYGMFWS